MITIGRTAFLASALFAVALPGSASAQYGEPTPPPAQSTGNHGEAMPAAPQAAPAAPATASEAIAAAACVLGHNASAGDPLFATSPYSAAERQQAVRLLGEMRRCTRHPQMVSSAAMIRGAFAQAAVRVAFATPQAPRDPPLGAMPLIRPTEGDAAFNAQIGPMYQLVDCATPREPDLARAVLATDPGTPAEAAAVTALNPTFIACVPAGSQIRIDRRLIRFMFAESLYRWSVVQRDGPASQWAAAAAPPQTAAAAAH
jgi:hypothetical protein